MHQRRDWSQEGTHEGGVPEGNAMRYRTPKHALTVPDPIAVLIRDVGGIGFTYVTWSRCALVGDGTIGPASPGEYPVHFAMDQTHHLCSEEADDILHARHELIYKTLATQQR